MAKTCAFCGSRGPFSGEHVMPDWIARLFKVGRVQTTATRNAEPQRTWASVGSFGQRMKGVCEACNSGWMSDLETIAKPTLTRLFFPRRPFAQLDPDEQLVVASWLWKVCIVFELATDARYFNDADRRCLYLDDVGEPPPEAQMWLGLYIGENVANIRGGPATFSAPDGRTMSGMQVTLTVGLMAAQILAVRPLPGTRARVTTRREFGPAERQIWPTQGTVDWPPQALDTENLRLWHRRWNTPPNDE